MSYRRKMRALPGKVMSHICMKMRNYSKFIKFQRYLSPRYRKACKTSTPAVTLAIVDAIVSLSFSNYATSSALLYY